jgi:hypothetical protein
MLRKQFAYFHLGIKLSLSCCLLLLSLLSFAQQKITFNGTVSSDKNEPLAGQMQMENLVSRPKKELPLFCHLLGMKKTK